MKEKYLGSKQHLDNFAEARKLAAETNRKNGEEARRQANAMYNDNPKKCALCNAIIVYEKRANLFCSRTCGAKSSNAKREFSEEQKKRMSEKVSKTLTGRKQSPERIARKEYKKFEITCITCGKTFSVGYKKKLHKTCGSNECRQAAIMAHRKYHNGFRKTIPYFNKYENKTVYLESSWEERIADILTENDISWIRPLPLSWLDVDGKSRLYFPDFFLPDHDLYLDPKNPYCMDKDAYKMSCIEKMVSIVYGDLGKVERHIFSLV